MTVDIHSATHGETPSSIREGSADGLRGPIARVVVGSMAAGAATALVLTLVVFAGAGEAVITGATLVAFGVGWALIGLLSTRLTNQPQRWTYVPAVAMAATGLVLLALTPENLAMTRLSWAWPPVGLVLAIWMSRHVHRNLRGAARWTLTPVVAVLALAAVSATYENVTVVRDQHAFPAAPGRTYDVGGHRLYLDCHGHGSPTVVLSNGLGEVAASWARIVAGVDDTTRVCAYDRAGQGWSEDVEHPQDGVTAARDLHALLSVAGEHGPYVLVGHSIGGTYALTYAARYPQPVAGLVLLDSSSPEQMTAIPSYARQYALMRRGLAVLPSLSRLGVGRVFAAVSGSDLPDPAADQVRALTAGARGARSGRDEVSMLPQIFRQAQALTTFGNRPLAVLTAAENLDQLDGWGAAQDRLAALSGNHLHEVVDSTHTGLLEDQHASTASVDAVTDVVRSVRTGSALHTR